MRPASWWLAGALALAASNAAAEDPQQSFSTLYCFSGGNDGANPHAPLTMSKGGVLYGWLIEDGWSPGGAIFGSAD
ncbi:MAG: hypothetical protein U0Q18_05070 [Bryobacteraceae bacterium]